MTTILSAILAIVAPILIWSLIANSKYTKDLEVHKQVLAALKQSFTDEQLRTQQYKEMFENTKTEIERLRSSMDNELEAWKTISEQEIRKDSMQRSRSILRGQATEHLAPWFLEGYDPKDYRFIGNPIDYLITHGSSAIQDNQSDKIESIILLDIKTGKSELNKVQRRIRDAVVAGLVEFVTFNPDTKEIKTWKMEGKNEHHQTN